MTIPVGKTVAPNLINLPFREIHIDGDKIDHVDFLNLITQMASVLPRYQEGSFTATVTGITGTPSFTMEYRIIGYLVFLSVPVTTNGVSTSTSMTITGAPSIIWPAASAVSTHCLPVPMTDNSVDLLGRWDVGTTGVITCRSNFITGIWTAANTKGLRPGTFVYAIS